MLTYCIHKLIQTEPGADQIFSLNSSYCYNFTLWGCFITLLYNFRMWNSCSRKGQRAALASTPMKKQPGLQSWKLLLYQVLDRVAVTSKSTAAEDFTCLYSVSRVPCKNHVVRWKCFSPHPMFLLYDKIESLVLYKPVFYFSPERG